MQACSEACSESDDKDIHFESADSLVDDDICSDYNEVETIQSDVETSETSESSVVSFSTPCVEVSKYSLPSKSTNPLEFVVSELESIKATLKITAYKHFQLEAIQALQLKKDVIVVQPTGSGKSLWYMVSTLLNPGKVTLVIEPI